MDSPSSAAVVTGPLASFEVALRADLQRCGYAPSTIKKVIATMARLSAWMQREDIAAGQLSPAMLQRLPLSLSGTRPVVRFLRGCGAAPLASCVDGAGPVDLVVAEFARWLVDERGLTSITVGSYRDRARRFLQWLGEPLDEELSSLDAAVVTSFVLGHCAQVSSANAKVMVTGLRALLRFLHVAEHVPRDLSGAVPAVAGWRQASLPRGLEACQTQALLASCDRSTPVGRRDYALLMLLAQLGLRSAEAAALELSDLDWRTGELTVHGKAARIDRLPLPVAAGEALADYLTQARPRCESSAVFITMCAPYGAISSHVVRQAMYRACDRAGLARTGPHRLRHALATDLLRAGGSLAEVGQILRHRSALASSVYAKVDERSLSALVRAWPGGDR